MKSVCNGPGTLVLALFVLMAAGLAVGPQAQAGDFAFRKPITIDHTKVGSSATTLTNYPFLYSVTDSNLRTVANSGHVQDAVFNAGSVAVDGVYDAMQSGVSRNSAASGSGTGTQIDVTYTVPAGNNRLLLVGISATTASLPTVTSVTWDATGGTPQPLTLLGSQPFTNSKIWIYYRVNPIAGA